MRTAKSFIALFAAVAVMGCQTASVVASAAPVPVVASHVQSTGSPATVSAVVASSAPVAANPGSRKKTILIVVVLAAVVVAAVLIAGGSGGALDY